MAEGQELTHEGATGREFVVLVDGAANVRRKGRKVNTLGAGDFLGEIALITGTPRTATVTTTAPSRILVVTARDFRTLLRRMPSLQMKVLDTLASRLPDEYK
jgi:CRP/FNR family cyclic AMP-dependent transcriptional regulator